MFIVIILSRWLHIVSACLLIGGVFFIRFIVPKGLGLVGDDGQRRQAMLKMRRIFKMLAHSVILLLLITGIYNTFLAWDNYKLDEAVLHSLWGTHILFAGLAFLIVLYVLAGREPPRSYRMFMAVNFVILLLAVAASSSLKWARERAMADHAASAVISNQK
jgi:uncharacterized membrane protein